MEFKEYLMEDALEAIIDYREKTPKKSDTGIPTLSARSVKNNYINYSECYYISPTEYERFMVRGFPKKGDILLTTEAPMGMVAKLDRDDIAIAQCLLTLRGKSGVLDNDYLLYLLQSPYGQRLLKEKETGTTVTGIKQAVFRKIIVQLPDFKIQKKISSILNPLNHKIECNTRINDNLQRQEQALFRAWFVDFLPFGGKVPSDWRYVSFSDILSPRSEKSSDLSLPMFSVTDTGIHPRDEKFKKSLSMGNTKNKVVYQNDLVFGMSREILNWGIMRFPVGGVSSAYNVFAVSEKINSYYLESYMKENIQYFKDLIKPASREGQGIDKNALMEKKILMPTEDVLRDYYCLEKPLTRYIHHNVEEINRLIKLRDVLLPKLMSGEIDVSNIQR